MVNALSDDLRVEVARDKKLWVQDYSRGKPKTKLKDAGAINNRRGTTVRFHPDPEIFGEDAAEFGTLLDGHRPDADQVGKDANCTLARARKSVESAFRSQTSTRLVKASPRAAKRARLKSAPSPREGGIWIN